MSRRTPKDYGIAAGTRFTRLLVQPFTEIRDNRQWVQCLCDCGMVQWVRPGRLLNGNTRSCGCLRNEMSGARTRTHGMAGTKTYSVWGSMLERCADPDNKDYGGRGIRVCERWLNFANFYADMGPAPPGHSIERSDVNGHYEPANCHWTTRRKQANNTRRNRKVRRFGQIKTITEWAEIENQPPSRVFCRLWRNWSIEQALTLPKDTRLK